MNFDDLESRIRSAINRVRHLPEEFNAERRRELLAQVKRASIRYSKEGGKLARRGANFTARKIGDGARDFWENSDQRWQKVRKAVYATTSYSGVQAVFWSIDSAMDQHLRPYIGGWVNGNAYTALEYSVSIFGTALGLYFGHTIYKTLGAGGTLSHYVELFEKQLKKQGARLQLAERFPDLERKTKAAVGLSLVIPILAVYAAVRPLFIDDLMNRYVYRTNFGEIVQEASIFTSLPYLNQIREELSGDAVVSKSRIVKDAQFLRDRGYDISDRDLYILIRVIAVECGQYYKHKNFAEKQKRDMRAILDDTFARVATSTVSDRWRPSFNGDREVSFENVLTLRRQYSSVTRRNMALWDSGYKQGNLLQGTKFNSEKNKIKLAYLVILEGLYGISRNPYDDTTGGSVFFMNQNVTGKSWQGVSDGDFTRVLRIKIEGHHHYALVGKTGENVGANSKILYFIRPNLPTQKKN